ncbi:hypothetical protein AB0I82_14080 [Streptomyces sp. NPDC050315]|uniref:hypothetical protein n=1 Tax=Streptomyces sp. NPDC050315 TaxID=3155039 RepID=UPI00341E9ACB
MAVLGTDVRLVRDIARIPASLPAFSAPDLSAAPHLLGGAVPVALVALAQAAGIGRNLVPHRQAGRTPLACTVIWKAS